MGGDGEKNGDVRDAGSAEGIKMGGSSSDEVWSVVKANAKILPLITPHFITNY